MMADLDDWCLITILVVVLEYGTQVRERWREIIPRPEVDNGCSLRLPDPESSAEKEKQQQTMRLQIEEHRTGNECYPTPTKSTTKLSAMEAPIGISAVGGLRQTQWYCTWPPMIEPGARPAQRACTSRKTLVFCLSSSAGSRRRSRPLSMISSRSQRTCTGSQRNQPNQKLSEVRC